MNPKIDKTKAHFFLSLFSALIFLFFFYPPLAVQAQTDRIYGPNNPFTLEELPESTFTSRLRSLSPESQERAKRQLEQTTFSQEDLQSYRVDRAGNILYVDSLRPEQGEGEVGSFRSLSDSPFPAPSFDVFKLHSNPRSKNIIYLDFDGHVIRNSWWNEEHKQPVYRARAFSRDSDTNSFNNEELSAIADIWSRIADHLSPFDVDITTEEPKNFHSKVGHVLFTMRKDKNGIEMPYSKVFGGVSYGNIFGVSSNQAGRPALVYDNFPNSLVAITGLHEFGHYLGLSHDGTTSRGQGGGETYYFGHGHGNTSWAPIMGNASRASIVRWSNGNYPHANNPENDIALITKKLGLKKDDHSNRMGRAATAIVTNRKGALVVSSPLKNPLNPNLANRGAINSARDKDIFFFRTRGGKVDIIVHPYWGMARTNSRRASALDLKAFIRDQQGRKVAESAPLKNTLARVRADLPPGKYYLVVQGHSDARSAYNSYGNIGEYFLTGTVLGAMRNRASYTPLTVGKRLNSRTPIGKNLVKDFIGFNFIKADSPLTAVVRGYDIDEADEVSVKLNGRFLGYLKAGPNNSEAPLSFFKIPKGLQVEGTNILVFQQKNSGRIYGISSILLRR